MPANLSPEYLSAEQRFKAARTFREKLEALEEMLATIPKHKGTEKMQADIKRRIAKVRSESQKKGGPAHALPFYQVDKEGAGQLALVGPPNAGKSLLLARLTHAQPEVADYPFTTRLPLPGMMNFENVQFQLVDLPPVSEEFMESWLPIVVRQADGVILVADLSADDLLEEVENTRALMEKNRIVLGPPASALEPGWMAKRTLLAGNKLDRPGAEENFEALRDLFGDCYAMAAVSAETGVGLDRLRRAVFDLLEVVRVFTKAPGKKPELTAPYVLKRGSTALDAAAHVHHDFAAQLKFARIWGHSKFEGQMVQREHVLQDGDIIEFHI
jgi:ribosome-interacting GTPase 1